ncbi:MAG: helix-turn-helix transcriptional regulator [Oscillatoria sp. PMC 1051.18]|nr:helix-turn-helix transcriptional regulator [Oscillatoria sp. PMC 1050.18]MEC5033098.1 helix-turn-helix transcriptional regulator [Oscillatoria sp. PMC 1051.18]
MDSNKRQRLEAAGWQVGTVSDFLELKPAETNFIELKLALTRKLKEIRKKQQLSQEVLASKMQSSQSRIAKIEAGDASVSLDLIVRALFYSGATHQDIASVVVGSERKEVGN